MLLIFKVSFYSWWIFMHDACELGISFHLFPLWELILSAWFAQQLSFTHNVPCYLCHIQAPCMHGSVSGHIPSVSVTLLAFTHAAFCIHKSVKAILHMWESKYMSLLSWPSQWFAFSSVWWWLWKHAWI